MGRKAKRKEDDLAQTDLVTDGALGDGFSDPVNEVADEQGRIVKAQWTAQQVMARRPQTAEQCLALLAGGMPTIRVSKLLGLSPRTVNALKNNGLSLAQIKQRAGTLQMFASEIAAEAIIEDFADPELVRKIPTVQKAMISGIMTQRAAENLSNGVQVSVQVSVPMTHDQYLEALRSASMGLGAENSGGKGEATPAGEAGQAGAEAETEVPRAFQAGAEGHGPVIDITPDKPN